MAVKLRLTRMGRKKRPFYRIIAVDSRQRRDGSYLEAIGTYNPLSEAAPVSVDHDLAIKWLGVGAQPSDTVRNLLSRSGVLLRWDLSKRKATPEQIEEAVSSHMKHHGDKVNARQEERSAKAEAARKADEEKAAKELAAAQAKAAAEAAAAAAPAASEEAADTENAG
jgi:small subunit ribosomal protein S16